MFSLHDVIAAKNNLNLLRICVNYVTTGQLPSNLLPTKADGGGEADAVVLAAIIGVVVHLGVLQAVLPFQLVAIEVGVDAKKYFVCFIAFG